MLDLIGERPELCQIAAAVIVAESVGRDAEVRAQITRAGTERELEVDGAYGYLSWLTPKAPENAAFLMQLKYGVRKLGTGQKLLPHAARFSSKLAISPRVLSALRAQSRVQHVVLVF